MDPRVPESNARSAEPGATSIDQILQAMSSRPGADPRWRAAIEEARSALATDGADDAAPFLSVLVRTQGKRIEPLEDAILCLAAQTDQDFEVLLLAHDAEPEASARIRHIVDRQVPSFRERITVVDVEGGHRGVPLNRGLERARGRYIAVYDDDDLVFANWVEEFHRAARSSQRLLRAVTATQRVQPEDWSAGQGGFRTLSWPKADYAKTFDQIAHLLVNHSPFMSWAFPAALFRVLGFRFDEDLAVCEDWDLILTGMLAFGVTDVPHLTAVYRRWENGESSYSRHSLESWAASEQRIIDRIDEAPILLAEGSMHLLRPMIIRDEAFRRYRFLFRGHELRPPLSLILRATSPALRLAVRVRDWRRRRRAENRTPSIVGD